MDSGTPYQWERDRLTESKYEAMKKVIAAAKALKGDLDAADESPTHFISYFSLTEALKELEE